ncbi:MAG: cysteine dioxygenase [Streptosporangiales bacterium]|nr:cysteine dioxygenase [Streptosporangiales bacterium]
MKFSGVPAGLELGDLPGRELDRRELRRLAVSLARRPELWAGEVTFDEHATGRYYANLHRDAHVDVWLLCWRPQDDTGWHDHDVSSGAVAVVAGELVEHNLAIGRPTLATVVGEGNAFCFGPEHIHRLTGHSATAVSIHAYSPPLWRMGQYALSRTGVLRRVSVSYADELRPLEDVR